MEKWEKVLVYLRDKGGTALRSAVLSDVFSRNSSASELDEILGRDLAGLVYVNRAKKWVLTAPGWVKANTLEIVAPVPPESQEATFSDPNWTRFKELAKANPDASAQRLLQLAGRHIGDPLESEWAEWRE